MNREIGTAISLGFFRDNPQRAAVSAVARLCGDVGNLLQTLGMVWDGYLRYGESCDFQMESYLCTMQMFSCMFARPKHC